jgi:hypothetical protein
LHKCIATIATHLSTSPSLCLSLTPPLRRFHPFVLTSSPSYFLVLLVFIRRPLTAVWVIASHVTWRLARLPLRSGLQASQPWLHAKGIGFAVVHRRVLGLSSLEQTATSAESTDQLRWTDYLWQKPPPQLHSAAAIFLA